MIVQYLKGVFESSEMKTTIVMDERTYLILETQAEKKIKSVIYPYFDVQLVLSRGMTAHQCGEWNIFVSLKGNSPHWVLNPCRPCNRQV